MLRILDRNQEVLDILKLKFTKRNIEKIAYNWDSEIEDFDMSTKSARLKDSLGRILFIDEVSKRALKKLAEAIVTRGYPDDGTGIATDDDRPPGNIVFGQRQKRVPYFNKLTPFNTKWDVDSGDWKWDEFENSQGMEDFDNYSNTLFSMKKLFPKETWKNIWKRMKDVPDDVATAQFKKAGQPWRKGGEDQIGIDKSTHLEVDKDAEDAELKENVISKIDLFLR